MAQGMSKEGRQLVEVLGRPGPTNPIVATDTNARVQLGTGTYRISLKVVGGDIRYRLGGDTVSAVNGHFVGDKERLDFRVEPGEYIAVIREGSVNAKVEITELL